MIKSTGKEKVTRGREAEQLAVLHLLGIGLTLVARNWRCRGGEIDVIMRDGDEWVFVEVRSRLESTRYGTAKEAIHSRKQQRVRQLAERYATLNGLYDARLRCDAVAVTFHSDGRAPVVEHFRAAF
ncbi:YraN family protein [Paenibacillus marinisediminis]